MNILKWNADTSEWAEFTEGEKITAGLVDPTFDEDVTVTTSESGLVLTSPNGDTWRVQVSDLGILTVTNITPV